MSRTFTLEEVARHDGRDGTCWTVIDGVVYDITTFMPRHPGDSLIELAAGRDATVLVESYHPGPGLERMRRVLDRKCERLGMLEGADTRPSTDPRFLQAIQRRVGDLLRERGLDYHSGGGYAFYEAVLVVVLAIVAWYARVFHGSYIAAVAAGVLMARMGFLMHSGNHAALGRRTLRNRFMGRLMEFIGASSFIWRHTHQVAHHGNPNIHGADNDCEIGTPLLRFHPAIERRPLHRIQHIGLAIGMSIGLVKWIVTDVFQLRRGRAVNVSFYVSPRRFRLALLYKALWVTAHVLVPIAVLGLGHALGTFFVMMAVGAYYMEGIFIVNHLQDDLVPPPDLHWAQQQIYGSANWRAGSRVANFVSGGLNHQVEHHLFPSMAVHLYPIIAPVVRQTCEEFGLPYRDYPSYCAALWGTTTFLHRLGRPEADTEVHDPFSGPTDSLPEPGE